MTKILDNGGFLVNKQILILLNEKVFFGKLLLILLFSVTGGANVPALNELMASWGIAFGDTVLEGDFTIGPNDMNYASGTGIVRFPDEGIVISPPTLKDQGQEILGQGVPNDMANTIPVLGFYQSKSTDQGGRIVTYGDSNCIDR